MENKLSIPNQTVFEQIRKSDENKNEYWVARDLSKVLEYSEYRHFKPVIDRAKEACKNSKYKVADHFEDILDMVPIGSGAEREIGGTMPENLPTEDSIKKIEKAKGPKTLKSLKKKKQE